MYETNRTAGEIIKNSVMCAAGLFVFAFGVYMTIQANIGVGPWDVLGKGIAGHIGLQYGTVLTVISATILLIDVIMREPIGIGMILDTCIVGKSVDLYNWLNIVPAQQSLPRGIAVMLIGIIIECLTMYWYMKASLGCGPRDTFLVALCKRMPKIPIGAVDVGMLALVTLIGWLLGGPVGIGTLMAAFLAGPILQFVFKIFRFDAAKVHHQNLLQSLNVLKGR